MSKPKTKDPGRVDWKDNPTEAERLDMIESFLASAGLDLAVPELQQARNGEEIELQQGQEIKKPVKH